MHRTPSVNAHQQHRINTYRGKIDSIHCFNLLTGEALFDQVESLLPAHRERLYPPTETLSMFLAQTMGSDRSCQQIVNQAVVQRLLGGLSASSTHTGGYCRARQRIPVGMIQRLTHYIGDWVDQQVPDQWLWRGRRVRVVDGTTMTMPDTEDNQCAYPQQSAQLPGLGFPICRLVGVTCLSSGVLKAAAIGRYQGKGGNEQSLLRSLQDTFDKGDIVLADAYFSTWFFIAEMQAKGVDIVMEQYGARRRSTDFRRGKRLGQRDHIVQYPKPIIRPQWMTPEQYESMPESLCIRECHTGGKLLVTTLLCPKTVSKMDLKTLYQSRWHVELDIRHIKTTMGMETLSCKTPDMVQKEIWVHLLAYNLIHMMMLQSALIADIEPRKISFKHCLQLWLNCRSQLNLLDEEQFHALLMLMAQQQVGNRPGRIEPRVVKRRPKQYSSLRKPRHVARQLVLKYGHPKKLK